MLRIGVLVSGGGTNLQAIMDAIQSGRLKHVTIALVISNNQGAYALDRAKDNNIRSLCISPKNYSVREEFDLAVRDALLEAQVDLVVLAGYLVRVGSSLIETYKNRIINIHPSLIPAFCGKGYYGIKVHEEVLNRGVKITGATVHFVDEGMDTGPIIIQKAVEVLEGDTAESLQRRVMEEAEWDILPRAIDMIAKKKADSREDKYEEN